MLATHVTSGTCLLEPKNGIFPVWPLFSNLRFRALIWRRAIDPISVARRVSGAEDHKNTIIVLIKIQKCMVVTIYVRNILTTDPYRKDGIFSLQAAHSRQETQPGTAIGAGASRFTDTVSSTMIIQSVKVSSDQLVSAQNTDSKLREQATPP